MLRAYSRTDQSLVAESLDAATLPAIPSNVVWIDLLRPSETERRVVEQFLSLELPTREEAQEIELSARLYHESDAEFMTVTALTRLDGDDAVPSPITFVLKGLVLVTLRYEEPRAFTSVDVRLCRPAKAVPHAGELVMLNLLEAMIDRIADALERIGSEVDGISRDVFRNEKSKASTKSRNLQSAIEEIGRKGNLLNSVRDGLVSFYRLLTYHAAAAEETRKDRKEARARVKLLQRDIASLREHASYLSTEISFLLDATLGLINLEQNQIIKIFSIAAVVFLPPTLVASIYGMNFRWIPELSWTFGYPLALVLMVVSAILPYLFFKQRGWL